ncbi:MAG: hypothetical protein QG628_90 [Patescibacteria group bacterium]|jgi:muramoyltetrapeptide carboxypeptidase|nr:hypothetical protein [Patescibacteria group bacterium]
MNTIFPDKLKRGDEVRVIAPALSLNIISQDVRDIAKRRFDELGLKLTFGKNVDECDEFMSSSVQSRVADLHEAFADKNVKAVLTVLGGHNSNQILRDIDWDIVKNNPKILCGYSDITTLNNAIYAKTGLVTYLGLHYSTFGMEKFFEETLEYFKKCVFSDGPVNVVPSKDWNDDEWYLDQQNRMLKPNVGWKVINEGSASGTLIGGNLCTLNLLQGTEFMPTLKESILFIEDDSESKLINFDRNLVSLIQQPGFDGVRGIVIGRFQKDSNVDLDLLAKSIHNKKELDGLPVIANVDFGHTKPMITFPVGGQVEIDASNTPKIIITKH